MYSVSCNYVNYRYDYTRERYLRLLWYVYYCRYVNYDIGNSFQFKTITRVINAGMISHNVERNN